MHRIGREAILSFMALSVATGSAQEGVIEFSDVAPPPTEQEKAAAKETSDRAAILSNWIQTFSSALNATLLLRDTVAKLPPAAQATPASVQLTAALAALRSTLDKTVVEDTGSGSSVWKIDQTQAQNLVGETIQVAQRIAQESSAAGGAVTSAATLQIDRLSYIFDAMVAEHAILNRKLRYYPYAALASQSPVSCQTVNAYSRDFKCLHKDHASAPDSSQWKLAAQPFNVADYCISPQYQNFHVNDWSAGFVTMVRKASFADHVLQGRLDGSLVPNAHTPQVAGGTC